MLRNLYFPRATLGTPPSLPITHPRSTFRPQPRPPWPAPSLGFPLCALRGAGPNRLKFLPEVWESRMGPGWGRWRGRKLPVCPPPALPMLQALAKAPHVIPAIWPPQGAPARQLRSMRISPARPTLQQTQAPRLTSIAGSLRGLRSPRSGLSAPTQPPSLTHRGSQSFSTPDTMAPAAASTLTTPHREGSGNIQVPFPPLINRKVQAKLQA